MRVTAISDLHGAIEHLDAVGRQCDALLVLGDLINVLDYRTMDGILVEVFGREPVAQAARLRSEGRFEEAREAIRNRAAEGEGHRERFLDLARQGYERVLEALPGNTFVTYGNADVPALLRDLKPDRINVLDGEVTAIGSMTFGLVGGGVSTPMAVPGEVADAEFDAKLDRVGAVDVICTHMPPGSVGLIAYVQRHQPKYALFGHVHQPLVARGNIGMTELVNVGHFQATGQGFTIDVPD
jgi:Icc-related predicted phosphoesterase